MAMIDTAKKIIRRVALESLCFGILVFCIPFFLCSILIPRELFLFAKKLAEGVEQ